MKEKLPASSRHILHRLLSCSSKTGAAEPMPVHAMIRLLRRTLRMTQTQLAKRAKLPQSHIATIEGGKVDIQLSTLRRIFRALFCEMVLLPKPEKVLDSIVADRVKETARRKVSRVMGTMALEKQLPDNKLVQDLVRKEEDKLRTSGSSEIWEE